MKIPGPDHPITIAKNPNRVRVTWQGRVIADTTRALVLKEASYPGVQYIPREDAEMSLLTPSAHQTYCPYKGDASYLSINVDGKTADNVIWSYQQPYDAVKEIAGHLAFYPDKVDKIEELPA